MLYTHQRCIQGIGNPLALAMGSINHLNEDTKPIEVETPKTFQRISIDKCIDFFESKNVEIYYFLFALKEIIKDWKFPQEKEK